MVLSAKLNEYQIDALSTEYLVFLTPSAIGSLSVLVVSIIRWRHLNKQVYVLVQLALADFLAAVLLMVSSAMNKGSIHKSEDICQYTLPLSLTFYLISCLLVLVYAWKSKRAIQGWRVAPTEDLVGQNWYKEKIVSIAPNAAVWLVPIIVCFAYIYSGEKNLDNETSLGSYMSNGTKNFNSCILFLDISEAKNHDILIGVNVLLIVTSVMLCCTIIYSKVGKWYEQHKQEWLFPVEGDGRSGRKFKTMFSTTRNMMIVILFCWTPAVVLILILVVDLMSSKNFENKILFGLYVIQAATVSLQGFLNSMVYAWGRPNFTEAILGENTPLVAYGHIAFFDESLRSC